MIIFCPIASNGGVETHVLNILRSQKCEIILITRYFNRNTNLAKHCKQNGIKILKLQSKNSFYSTLCLLLFGFKNYNRVNNIYSCELNYQVILFSLFLCPKKTIYNLVGNPIDIANNLYKYKRFIKNNIIIVETLTHVKKIKLPLNLKILPHISHINRYNAIKKNDNKKIKIAHLGWLQENKMPLELLELFKDLKMLKPDVQLTFFGNGPLLIEISKKIEEYQLEDCVFMENGWSNEFELRQIHEQIDFCVFLSKSEGLPLTLIECCAYGTPFLATDVGAISELLTFSKRSRLLSNDQNNWTKELMVYCDNYNITNSLLDIDLQKQFNERFAKEELLKMYVSLINCE